MMFSKQLAQRFLRDAEGNVVFTLAVSILPLLFLIGYCLDLRHANNLQASLQEVVDAGSLAGGRALQMDKTDDEIIDTVRAFAAEFTTENSHRLDCDPVSVTVDRMNTLIQTSVNCGVPTSLSALMGINELDIGAENEARFDLQSVDIAFVLDVSVSMTDAKLQALRDAATSAVELLLPDSSPTSSDLRVAFVPYSHVVNAGSFFEDLTDEAVNRTYPREVLDDGETCSTPGDCLSELQSEGLETIDVPYTGTCIWERGGADAFTDAPPGLNRYLSAANPVWFFGANDQDKAQGLAGITTQSPGGFFQLADNTALNLRYDVCQSSEIYPLADSRSDATTYIASITDRGRGTNGALGLAVGWYLISDEWRNVWPSGSEPLNPGPDNSKFMIFMTDGILDDWRLDTGIYGDQATQALEMCDAIKDEDITIFTVSFEAPLAAATLLEQCASSSSTAFVADNAAELEENFREIARLIRPLRLSR